MQVVANVAIVVAVVAAVLTAVAGHRSNRAAGTRTAPPPAGRTDAVTTVRVEAPQQRRASVDREPDAVHAARG